MADTRTPPEPGQSDSDSAVPRPFGRTDEAVVLAWAPWVGAAAAAGVYVGDGLDTVFGMEPTGISVVVLAAALAGWLSLALQFPRESAVRLFGATGGVVLSALLGYALVGAPLRSVGWLLVATLSAAGFAAATDRLLSSPSPAGRSLSALVVFAQALDGTTTAVGVDVLGYGEQSALSASILAVGAEFPLVLGGGWLFVLLKVLLATAVVGVLRGGTADRPGTVALAVAAFVGLGPAVHNLVLFAV